MSGSQLVEELPGTDDLRPAGLPGLQPLVPADQAGGSALQSERCQVVVTGIGGEPRPGSGIGMSLASLGEQCENRTAAGNADSAGELRTSENLSQLLYEQVAHNQLKAALPPCVEHLGRRVS